MRDFYSNVAAVIALAPVVQAAAVEGATVDLSEASGVVFMLNTGAVAGAGDFGAKLQESADGAAWADVAAKYVQSNAPATLEANKTYVLGYTGKLKFARIALTKAGGTSIAAGAVAALRPLTRPVP